jgi:hypothetical protein
MREEVRGKKKQDQEEDKGKRADLTAVCGLSLCPFPCGLVYNDSAAHGEREHREQARRSRQRESFRRGTRVRGKCAGDGPSKEPIPG